MLTLQEAFRQLALDLNAVTQDDPELDDFTINENGIAVDVDFRAYKKDLTVEARVSVDGCPRFYINKRGPIDRLGQRLGIDEKQVVDDAAFNAAYELAPIHDEDLDALSVKHALASMFAHEPARQAVIALDKDGLLPVRVTSSGVEWENANAGKSDLQPARIKTIAADLAALARALPNVPASKKSNAPLVDLNGRKRIRRERGESFVSKVFDVFDMWWLAAVMFVPTVLPAWGSSDSHFVAHRLWLFALLFAVPLALALPTFLVMFRGTPSALANTLWRALGVGALTACVVYFGAQVLDVVADTATPTMVSAKVVAQTELGPLTYTTLRTSKNETLRVWSDNFGKPNATIKLALHRGRLGWRWFEKVRDRD